MLVAWPTLGEGRSSLDGVLLILAALVSYGFALNLARPLQQRNGALPVIWRAQAVALVLTAPARPARAAGRRAGRLGPCSPSSPWARSARRWPTC